MRALPCRIRDPNFHYSAYKSTSLGPILSQLNLVNNITPASFFKMASNVISPSTIRYPMWPLLFGVSDKNFVFLFTSRPCVLYFHPPHRVQTCSRTHPPSYPMGTRGSPSYSAEVKECAELYLHSPSTPSWRDARLKITGTILPLPYRLRSQVFPALR
jgi:hypothetical protein